MCGQARNGREALEILERDGLGTDVPLRERVVLVAANGGDPLSLYRVFQPANGFTQIAGTVMNAGLIQGSPRVSTENRWPDPDAGRTAMTNAASYALAMSLTTCELI